MPQGFFGYIPTTDEVWFVMMPPILSRGERMKAAVAVRRIGEAKIKAAGIVVQRHYTTEAKAQAVAKRIKEATGLDMHVCRGCYA